MYTSNTSIHIDMHTFKYRHETAYALINFGAMELVEFMLHAFFYDQAECSGRAYGILILAARAATRFPRQLLEFRAISRKWENDGIWIKHFKRTAVVQEFLLIKSYERLFGAIRAIHFFLHTACILNPSCFQKVPSLGLSRWLRPPFGSIPFQSVQL